MVGVLVQIVRWVDDYNPGIVECQLNDYDGHVWSFIEKVPIVTEAMLDASSAYPQPGVIACMVIKQESAVVHIDTSRPWHVESVDGETHFRVSIEALTEWQQ